MKKKIIILSAILSAAVLLTFLLFRFVINDKDNNFDNEIFGTTKDLHFLYNTTEQKTIVVYSNGTQEAVDGVLSDYREIDPYEYEFVSKSKFNLDGGKGAFIVDYACIEKGGTLYYVAGLTAPVRVADGVSDFVISDSGNGLIYWTDFIYKEAEGDEPALSQAKLHLFNGIESTVINESVFLDYYVGGYLSAVISPNAGTVFYITDLAYRYAPATYEIVSIVSTAYVSVDGGNGQRVSGDTVLPLAVADGAEYLYYTDEKSTFKVRGGVSGEEVPLFKIATDFRSSYFFNNDYSQVVYNIPIIEDGMSISGSAYISINGTEGSELSPYFIDSFLIPQGGHIGREEHGFMTVYGFKDFSEKVSVSGDMIRYIDHNLESQLISEGAFEVTLSADGKNVFFLDTWDDDNLKRATISLCDVTGQADIVINKIAEMVDAYVITRDGYVYYVVDEHVLHRIKADSADGAVIIHEYAWAENLSVFRGETVFFLTAIPEQGRKPHTLRAATGDNIQRIADEVEYFYMYEDSVFYFVCVGTEGRYGDYNVFRSSGGRAGIFNFEHLTDGVHLPVSDFEPDKCRLCGILNCWSGCIPCSECGEQYCWRFCVLCEICGDTMCFEECVLCEKCGERMCFETCGICEDCGEWHSPWAGCETSVTE
jgi:hypothetical protein